MKKMVGGRTNYGEIVGILMLDTVFPRFPGDVGNASTYPFPVRYHVIKDAKLEDVMVKSPNMSLLDKFIEAAQQLEEEGVRAITTSCGYLAPYQYEIANSVNIPVVTSSLMMIPFINQMIRNDRKIAIFTEMADNMNDDYFMKIGWSSKEIPIVVKGMPENAEFPKVYSYDKTFADWDELALEMSNMALEHMKEHPDTAAIVLECTNMGSFAKSIQDAANVPVFGINNLVEFVASAVNAKSYIF